MRRNFERLLAKSVEDEGYAAADVLAPTTLLGHTIEVFNANAAMSVQMPSMLRAVGLEPSRWLMRLHKTSALAAAVHDLGKASNQFQSMLQNPKGTNAKQTVRHEWISAWIINQEPVKQWLLPAVDGCENCWHIASYAVTGHHPKHDRTAPNHKTFQSESERIEVYSIHPDFTRILKQFQEWFDLNKEIDPNTIQPILYAGEADRASMDAFVSFTTKLDTYWSRNLNRSNDWKRFCAVVKATLICADVAGSALWEKIDQSADRTKWITESLERVPSRDDLGQIVNSRLEGKPPYEFQTQIAGSKASVTLVEAACGGGKTAAAYMWARDQYSGRRLWFCYPTTGTATEGYRGYLHDKLPKDSSSRADLFHSRSQYDICYLLETRDPEEDETDTETRIQSLRAWDTQIVACTIDTVLCLLQNQRKGVYAWPSLANSVVVFDEIHCYDNELFGNLLTWIEKLVGIPVLLMTASLPRGRRLAIEEAASNAGRSYQHIPNGSKPHETLNRYQHVSDADSARNSPVNLGAVYLQVKQEFDSGGRVLWICNTVDRCRDVALRLQSLSPSVYHSRFIYEHRLKQHSRVVDAFDRELPALASTTQVAEVSLDLGLVTLLLTELAPIPAMIQRLGRLNRRADPDTKPTVIRAFIVIEPVDSNGVFSPLPYDEADLELAREWLKKLGTQPISQQDLTEAWSRLDQSATPEPESSNWLSGGPFTVVGSIRDSGHGITVICERHANDARRYGATQFALPMNQPRIPNWKTGQHVRGFHVAKDSAIEYDEHTGGRWVKND